VTTICLLSILQSRPIRLLGRANSELRKAAHHTTLVVGLAALGLAHDMLWPLPLGIGFLVVWAASAAQRRETRRVTLIVGLGVLGVAGAWIGLTGPHAAWLTQRKDFVFFDGLSRLLGAFGGFENPFLSGERLHYHWLGYAWLGLVDRVAQPDDWTLIPTIGPIVVTVMIAVGLLRLLMPRTRTLHAGLLTATLLLIDTERSWSTGVHLIRQESFSLLFGTAALIATVSACWTSDPWCGLNAIHPLLFAAITTASKISHGALAAALCMASIVWHSSLRTRTRTTALLSAVAASQIVILGVVFGLGGAGSDQSTGFALLDAGWQLRPELSSLDGLAYATTALVLLGGVSFLVIAWIASMTSTRQIRSKNLGPLTLAVTLGFGATLMLTQILAGQMFFLHAAVLLSLTGCAFTITDDDPFPSRGQRIWVGLAMVAVFVGLSIRAPANGSSLAIGLRLVRSATPVIVLLIALVVGLVLRWHVQTRAAFLARLAMAMGLTFAAWNWTTEARTYYGREQASLAATPLADPNLLSTASWIRGHVPVAAITATSSGLCDPERCSKDFEASVTLDCEYTRQRPTSDCHLSYGEPFASFTERRTFINNFSQFSTGQPTKTMLDRARKSINFAQKPGVDSVAPLREAGVTWFIVDKELPHAADYGAVGKTRYENARFIVLELHDR